MPTVTKPIILDDTGKAIVEAIKELSSKSLTGPQGPAGPAGPAGPEGPTGPSGVNLDGADFVLFDERGNSTKGTMTQKSISKFLNNMEVEPESDKERIVIGQTIENPTVIVEPKKTDFHGQVQLNGTTVMQGGEKTSSERIVIGRSLSDPTVILTPSALMVKKITDLNGNTISGGGSSSSSDNALPSYYYELIEQKAEQINTIQFASGPSLDFFYFSDSHWSSNRLNSTAIIASLQKMVLSQKVIFGGDVVGKWDSTDSDLPYLDGATHAKMIKLLDTNNFYQVRGNHDMWARVQAGTEIKQGRGYIGTRSTTGSFNYGYDAKGTASFFMATMGHGFFSNPNDIVCSYGYKDEPNLNLRLVFIDTTNLNAFGGFGISETEMKWIIEEAILKAPSGYRFVFYGHVPALPCIMWPDNSQANTLKLFKAINTKTSYNGYSFSNTGNVIAYIAGHEHADNMAFKDGVLHLVVSGDAFHQDHKTYCTLYLHDLLPKYNRTAGTINEQVVSWMSIDLSSNIFYNVRIGAGYDSIAHLTPVKLSVGASTTITPKIAASSWFSFDADCASELKEATKSDVCSVSSDGIVTAKKTGEATVYAIASDGTNEAFSIIVE